MKTITKIFAAIALALPFVNAEAEDYGFGDMGGVFNVSESGAATYTLPFDLPEGINGMVPSLGLVYNSQSGNGVAGMGVSIYGTSVITRTVKDIYHDEKVGGITYTDSDVYSLDGVRLIQKTGGSDFRPENSPNDYFMKTTYGFKAELQNGNIAYFEYKATANGVAYAWYLNKVEDRYGNVMYYSYSAVNGCVYLSTVTYGGNLGGSTNLSNKISFEYEDRDDKMPYIVNGAKCSMNKRLKSVTITTNGTERNKYTLTYSKSNTFEPIVIKVDGKYMPAKPTYDAFSRLTKVEENYGTTKLPPVTLEWKTFPATPYASSVSGQSYNFDDQMFTCGDVTGNGISDVIALVDNDNSKSVRVYEVQDGSKLNFKYEVEGYPKDVFISKDVMGSSAVGSVINFYGKGNHDLILYDFLQSKPQKVFYIDLYIQTNNQKKKINTYVLHSNNPPIMTYGDFFNNGTTNIVQLGDEKVNGKYELAIWRHDNKENKPVPCSFWMSLPSDPEKLFTSDYNGDGLQDLLVIYDSGYTIYWNQGVDVGTSPFSDTKKTTGTNLCDAKMIMPGDFNGDGTVDFLSNKDDDSIWYIFYGTGNGTFTKTTACTLSNIHGNGFTGYDDNRFECHVFDFNNDGKDDVVITKADYEKKQDKVLGIKVSSPYGSFLKTYTCWLKSNGTTLTVDKIATSKKEADAKNGKFLVGDFNGDGYIELMNYGYDCYGSTDANVEPSWRIYRNPSVTAATNKLTSISVGQSGISTSISYSTLSDADVYTKGSASTYPVATLCIPLNVVKKVFQIASANQYETNYKYSGLRVHLQGRGFLGFTTVEANNTTTGEKRATTINSLNTSFYEPSKITTTITKGNKTATTESIFKVITDSKNDKIHFTYPYTIKETGFYGEITTSIDTFDNKFRLLKQQTKYYKNANMYKQVEYNDYKKVGGVYKPQTVVTTQKHYDDANAFTTKTTYTYDTKGNPTKMVENAATVPVTHEYSYNKFGNLLIHKVSYGTTSDSTTLKYDGSNRFVASEESSANSLITNYTYNNLGRLTQKQEGVSGSLLTTSYTYDAIGNITKITHPDGTTTTYTRSWGTMPYRSYSVTTKTTGQAATTTWYDNLGREVETTSTGEKGVSLTSTKSYNTATGQLYSHYNKIGGITISETRGYNKLGQLTSVSSNTGKKITYSYSAHSVTSTQSGINYILQKKFDAWGNTTHVSVNACTSTTYKYSSNGQPVSVRYADASYQDYMASTMTYDNRGLQTSLTDVDAGKTSYEYDALGRVTKQTDARGNITTNTYNASGLLIKQVCGDVTTTYTYDSRLRLRKEISGSQSISYNYDKYNRLTKKTYSIDGTVLTFSYTYNSNGQMATQTFPDGMTENYTYDANGYLAAIKIGGQRVWERDSYTGTQRRWALGTQPLYVTRKYSDKGLLTEQEIIRQAGSLHKMTYSFDGATGNLKSRTGMQSGTETFNYDQFDRLNTGTSYALNGNIASKTGIGKYTYDTGKKNAVVQVENTGNLIQGAASLTYNAFNKVATVMQGTNTLTITYGPDRQRTKTVLVNGSNTTTTLYADNYEQRTTNGITKSYHYVASPDGLAAVYVKSGNTATAYYIETDHLGSIVRAYDYIGNVKFSAAYDAWGNQTVSTNAIGLTRGYTGHEHWNQFGLIDMNGRFYDPLLGRFLSPDPYVQAPENPQNYNRYSYCLNNPLKYSDPDGEWVAEAIVICAMAYMGGVEANFMNANNPFNPADWNWKSASTYTGMVSGAMSGAGMVGYPITFLPKMDGMLVRGAAMATTNVVLNGVGNKLQGNEFLYNWQGAALSGFINGAISGYMLAQENGTNLWWGNEIKYGRSKWSFFTSELPYAEVKFDIKGCGVVEQNNCVPATFKELNDHFGGEASYSQIASDVKYTADGSSGYRPYLNKHYDYEQIPKTELENIEKIQKIRDAGKVISTYSNLGMSHADNVRKISYYSSGIVRVKLRAGSFNTSSMNSSWSFFLINGLK